MPMYFSLFLLQKIYRVGFLLILILIVLDLLAFFFFPDTLLSELFTATREQTPLTWLSALSFLFLGLGCLSVYYQSALRIWYFLAGVFLFFSLDDATYLHERLTGAVQETSATLLAFPTYAWVVLYAPLLIFAFSTLVYLLWKKSFSQSRGPILLGLLLLGGAFALDLLDGVTQKDSTVVFCLAPSCHLTVLHLLRLTEEVLEVLAVGLLGYTLLREHSLLPTSLTEQ